jgi:hypothetical protein
MKNSKPFVVSARQTLEALSADVSGTRSLGSRGDGRLRYSAGLGSRGDGRRWYSAGLGGRRDGRRWYPAALPTSINELHE